MESRKVEDLSLADVEPLMVHSHLLSKSVADAVAKRSKAILQATRKRKDGGGGLFKGLQGAVLHLHLSRPRRQLLCRKLQRLQQLCSPRC